MARQNKAINQADAEKIFDEGAAYITGRDIFPKKRAVGIFGRSITEKVFSLNHSIGENWNLYSYNGKELLYLTKKGFMFAVTLYNVYVIGEKKKESTGEA